MTTDQNPQPGSQEDVDAKQAILRDGVENLNEQNRRILERIAIQGVNRALAALATHLNKTAEASADLLAVILQADTLLEAAEYAISFTQEEHDETSVGDSKVSAVFDKAKDYCAAQALSVIDPDKREKAQQIAELAKQGKQEEALRLAQELDHPSARPMPAPAAKPTCEPGQGMYL